MAMSQEQLKEKVEECFSFGEQTLSANGDLPPMLEVDWIGMDDKSCRSMVVMAFGEKDKRDKFIRGLGVTLGMMERIGKVKETRSVCMISEAWLSRHHKDVDMKKVKMPSEDPNRVDALVVAAMTRDGECLFRAKEMTIVDTDMNGRRHFSLHDLPEQTQQGAVSAESNILKQFYDGQKHGLTFTGADDLPGADEAKRLPMEELFELSVKNLVKVIGGLDSEIINQSANNNNKS